MVNGFRYYRALESVSIASALSTALTIYRCQIRVTAHIISLQLGLCLIYYVIFWTVCVHQQSFLKHFLQVVRMETVRHLPPPVRFLHSYSK